MKRLLTAIFLSLILHALLFFSDLDLPARPQIEIRRPQHLTVTLSYRQPPTPLPKAVPKPPPPPNKKPIVKPEVKKKVQPKAPAMPIQQAKEVIQEVRPPEPEPEPRPAEFEPAKPEPAKPVSEPISALPEKAVESPRAAAAEPPVQAHARVAPPKPMALREARPAYRKNPPPPYPGKAKRRGIEGTVLLEVLVDSNGKVDAVKVFNSSGHAVLDRAALAAVRAWIFEPGMIGERPVSMRVRVPIRFELK